MRHCFVPVNSCCVLDAAAMVRFMRGRTNYLDHLAQVPMFSACSKKDLQIIGRASDEVTVAKGKVLVEQGKPGHEFFLILDGKASVQKNNRKTAELGAGQYFGEMALLQGGQRRATVRAGNDGVEVMALDRETFVSLIDESEQARREFDRVMAERLRGLEAAR